MRNLTRLTSATLAITTTAVLVSIATASEGNATTDGRSAPWMAKFLPAAVPDITPEMTPEQIKHLSAQAIRAKVIQVALAKKKNGRYVAGAASNLRFDCSGFTKVVFKQAAHKNLPHYSGAQMQRTRRVSKANLLPGDLMFWGRNGSQHASIYIGHGKMIGANNPSSGVRIDSIRSSYWAPRYAGAGRVING